MLTEEKDTPRADHMHEAPVSRALLVVNAKARQGQANFHAALQELQNQGIRLVDAHGVTNPRHIKPLVERAIERGGLDTVIVGGGDGTISALSNVLAKSGIRLGLLPMGTANDFARNLNITTDVPKAVQVIRDGYVQPLDLGLANERYFLNVASIGLGVEVASNMDNDLKKWIGPLAYGAAALQAFKELRPVRVHLTFKDRPHGDVFEVAEFEALQVAVANGRFYGGGIVSAPNATLTDRKLAVTVIEMMSAVELMQLLPGLRDGSYVRNPKVHHYTTTNVLVETSQPRNVNLDGEVCQRTPLTFGVAPAALKVFAPRP